MGSCMVPALGKRLQNVQKNVSSKYIAIAHEIALMGWFT